jgi:hypothetical protein
VLRYRIVAIGYGLDGGGIDGLWQRDIPLPSLPTFRNSQPPVQSVSNLSVELQAFMPLH